MGIYNNSNIVTNGLVFNFDANSLKSYKGVPGTNLLQAISPDGLSVSANNSYRLSSGTENVFIPSIGYMNNVAYIDILNDYNNSYGGGSSNNCCPRIFWFGNGVSVSPNTTYTYAIVYKATSGYTNSNYMYQYHFTSNGGTYVTEFGLHDTSKRIHLGDGWYWAWNTFTTGSTVNWIGTMGMWHYEYRTYSRVYVAKAMMMQGNWTSLHPNYWPNVATTRSNTQALVDLTGNTTITTDSLTYASNGSFSWASGVNARIQAPSSSNFSFGTGDFTLECWIKPDNFNNYVHMIALPDQNTFALKANTGDGAIYFYSPSFTTYPTSGWTLVAGVWNHVVMTRAGSTSYSYLNGSLKGSKAGFTNNFTAQTLNIGNGYSSEYTAKSIPAVRIYTRALTAQEVQQNFNAQRGLYGI